MKNALTVDVEDYFHVSAFSDVIERSSWSRMESRVENNVARLLQIFSDNDVRCTFFVLGWVAERYPSLVRSIVAEGHEIASHGYGHQLIYRQGHAEFREEAARSKAILEEQAQTSVKGYRAASYSITKDSLWALDILAELGFTYDSSIFPIRHDRYGLSGSPQQPYVIRTSPGRELTEVPLSVLPLAGLKVPVSGGGYFRIFPYFFTRWALRRLNERLRRPFVFYLHPWEIDPEQPRVGASRLSRFRHYTNLEDCESRLLRLLSEFEFQPIADLIRGLDSRPPVISRDQLQHSFSGA